MKRWPGLWTGLRCAFQKTLKLGLPLQVAKAVDRPTLCCKAAVSTSSTLIGKHLSSHSIENHIAREWSIILALGVGGASGAGSIQGSIEQAVDDTVL